MSAKEVTSDPTKLAQYWLVDAPTHCEVCSRPIGNVFTDGATNSGPWASMCMPCHRRHGKGFGTGRGQRYTKQEDGRWLKTAG